MNNKPQKCRLTIVLVTALVCGGLPAQSHAGTLLSESFLGSGPLAGTMPAVGAGAAWTTFYANNNTDITPAYQADSTGAGFPIAASPASVTLPINAQRSLSGTNFGAYTDHTDDGAFVKINPASTGMISASANFTFSSIAATNNPTAWAVLGFTTNLTNPDYLANAGSVGPWVIVRPTLATSGRIDSIELRATSGFNQTIIASSTAVNGSASHNVVLQYDPGAGTLNAMVDGVALLAVPYQYGGSNPPAPTINGVILGNRAFDGVVSSSTPSATTFTGVTVTQVPEPAAISIVSLAATGLLRRRRSKR